MIHRTVLQRAAGSVKIRQVQLQLCACPVGVTDANAAFLSLDENYEQLIPRVIFLFLQQSTCVVEKGYLTLPLSPPLFAAAERHHNQPDRRPVLAGRPHQARLQRRRTVLPGEPSDAVHGLPPRGQCGTAGGPCPPTRKRCARPQGGSATPEGFRAQGPQG